MNTLKIHSQQFKAIADFHTPVGLYARLRDRFPFAIMLESADYHDRSDSKSFIALQPVATFEARKGHCLTTIQGETTSSNHDDLGEVWNSFKAFGERFKVVGEHSPKLFGYNAFESVQFMENIRLQNGGKNSEIPDMYYALYSFVLEMDHFKNEVVLTHFYSEDQGPDAQKLEVLKHVLTHATSVEFDFQTIGEESSPITDADFQDYVRQGIHHCKRGDVFQVVLSRPFEQQFQGDEFNVYRALRAVNPSPYMFYFDYGTYTILGSSPEAQFQASGGIASINPIAGTIKRGATADEDLANATHLKNDPKENAEHVMLVDLARNDLSKYAEEVEVQTYAEIQKFSHVLHMVSHVEGKLTAGSSASDAFAGSFPAGTLSGAPKYRALQIIDELEARPRGFYGGSIGYFGIDGSVNQAIIIRSALVKNNTLHYQAGAGVVAGSTPEGELKEVYNKIAALRNAIQYAQEL